MQGSTKVDARLTTAQAAEMVGVTAQVMYRWRRARRGPRYYRRAGRIIYLKSDVESWELSRPSE